jgi:hypothetical protein
MRNNKDKQTQWNSDRQVKLQYMSRDTIIIAANERNGMKNRAKFVSRVTFSTSFSGSRVSAICTGIVTFDFPFGQFRFSQWT